MKEQTLKANLKLSKEKILAKSCRAGNEIYIIGGCEQAIELEKYNLETQKSTLLPSLNEK